MKIVTHNGVFHADEVTAVALIELAKCLDDNQGAQIVRSRDASLWTKTPCMAGSKDLPHGIDYIVDVGGQNDRQWRLDHHHLTKEDNDYGLSAAGLVWKYVASRYYSTYGVDYYGEYDGSGESASEANPVIDKLIKEIDANDTGIKRSDDLYHEVIRNLNGADPFNEEEQDKLFRIAVDFSKEVLRKLRGKTPVCFLGLPMTLERAAQIALTMGETTCQAIKANKQAKIKLEEAYRIAVANATKIGYSIEFPKGEIHVPAAFLIGTAHVAVQWDESQDCWSIQTIPLERGGFKSKFKLTPVGDEIFCHPAGFISKTKTGRFNLVEA